MTPRRVVRRIDHLSMIVDDARTTFQMLRDRLGLVVGIPVFDVPAELQAAAGERTGFFSLGNIAFEVVEASALPLASSDALEVNVIVFEPEPVDDAVAELDRRGIAHLPPNRIVVPQGAEFPVSLAPDAESDIEPGSLHGTQLVFQGFLGGNALVMCYEWAHVPVAVMRDHMRRIVDAGIADRPLPIDAATEVVVGATDFDGQRRRWQALLDPVVDEEPGLWDFGDGPVLRLVEHGRDAIVGLKLRVCDLARSERYLAENDMLAASSDDELAIAPEAIGGLNVTLARGNT